MKSIGKYDDFWLSTGGYLTLEEMWVYVIRDVELNHEEWSKNSMCELIRMYHQKWHNLYRKVGYSSNMVVWPDKFK